MSISEKIAEYVDSCFASKLSEEFSFGVEQEFFLYHGPHAATHEDSQAFLVAIAKATSGILQHSDDAGIGHHVSGCVISKSVRLKYEHHPHLLEFEFSPMSDLRELEPVLTTAFKDATEVAAKLGLDIEFRPFLRSDIPDNAVESQHSLCRSLRAYRQKLRARSNENSLQPSIANFSAYIASTHFHIGGVSASDLSRVFGRLYQLEPDTMDFAWSQVADADRSPSRRFHGFRETAKGLPLVCFPDLPEWNLKHWAEALLKMPVAAVNDGNDTENTAKLFQRKRDLSIIQPREYGTIEFRGDPCLPDAESILGVLAIRLGLVRKIVSETSKPVSADEFALARKVWFESKEDYTLSPSLIESAKEGFGAEHVSQAKYLACFKTSTPRTTLEKL